MGYFCATLKILMDITLCESNPGFGEAGLKNFRVRMSE